MAQADLSSYLKSPSLRAAVFDAMYFSIMIGLGEAYLGALGISLQGAPFQIGILSTFPPLVGAISQLIGLYLFEYGVPRKQIIIFSAGLQGIIWFVISSIPLLFPQAAPTVWVLIGCAILHHVFGNIASPSWNSLIGDLVPSEIRGQYFGLRNQRSGIITVLSMFYAGFILYAFRTTGREAWGFSLLFIIAGIARIASTLWLSRYQEPGYTVSAVHKFSFLSFIRRAPHSNFARFVFFTAAMQCAVSIAGPYFAIYMLRDLGFSYLQFALCIAIQLTVQFIFMQHWGRLTDLFGSKRILEVTGIGVSFSGLLWLFSSKIWFIIICQIYSGMMWAGYNLAAANFLFDAVSPPKRATCTAYMAVITGTFSFLGSLMGGYLLVILPSDFLISKGFDTPNSIYFKVFLISAFARIMIALFFLHRFKEVRAVQSATRRDIVFRITAIRPISGATFGIVSDAVKKTYRKLTH